jgi:hypothetical protein
MEERWCLVLPRRLIVLPILFLSSLFASASVQSTDYTIHQQFISVRAVGMGNAFIAVADDTSAWFYNPAALARRKDHELKLSLGAGMDTKVLDFYNKIQDANKQPTEDDKVNAITQLIQSNTGNYYSLRAPIVGAYYAWPRWQISFIPADLSLDMSIHRCVGPCLNVNGYLDSTLAATYAHPLDWFKGHQISWGTTIKAIHRVYAGQTIIAADLVEGTKVFQPSDADEGLTFDADLGMMWSPSIPKHGILSFLQYMKPTYAIVGRNLIDEGFRMNFHLVDPNSGQPPDLGRRVDVGSRWDLPKVWVFDPHIAIDERDMGDPNWTPRKGFHAGAELFWTMFNWWKGHWSVGYNQGYFGGGVGAKLAWFQFDFATYGEEVGTVAVPLQNRRYLAELSMDF